MRNIKSLITTLSENDFCVFKLCFLFSHRYSHSTCGWISLGLLTNITYFPLLRHVGVGLHFLGSTKLHMAIRLAFVNEMEGTGYFWWKPLNSNVHLACHPLLSHSSPKQCSLCRQGQPGSQNENDVFHIPVCTH